MSTVSESSAFQLLVDGSNIKCQVRFYFGDLFRRRGRQTKFHIIGANRCFTCVMLYVGGGVGVMLYVDVGCNLAGFMDH